MERNNNANSEIVPYNRGDFPIYIGKGDLSEVPNRTLPDHWHNDVEFIRVISGNINYNINGKIVSLSDGDGLFINSKQFHFGYSDDSCECVFICLAFQPSLFCSSKAVTEKYVTPVITNPYIPFYKLRSSVEWEREILDDVEKIYALDENIAFELRAHNIFFGMWTILFERLNHSVKAEKTGKPHLSTLKKMITFIQEHYSEKITLYDISQSGNVCKTACYSIFRKYTNQTPGEYLNEHRLRKSIELMKNSDMTLTEICYEVGFSGASYFAENFRRSYGCSPREYKKQFK